jgi:hypothetical protein
MHHAAASMAPCVPMYNHPPTPACRLPLPPAAAACRRRRLPLPLLDSACCLLQFLGRAPRRSGQLEREQRGVYSFIINALGGTLALQVSPGPGFQHACATLRPCRVQPPACVHMPTNVCIPVRCASMQGSSFAGAPASLVDPRPAATSYRCPHLGWTSICRLSSWQQAYG